MRWIELHDELFITGTWRLWRRRRNNHAGNVFLRFFHKTLVKVFLLIFCDCCRVCSFSTLLLNLLRIKSTSKTTQGRVYKFLMFFSLSRGKSLLFALVFFKQNVVENIPVFFRNMRSVKTFSISFFLSTFSFIKIVN